MRSIRSTANILFALALAISVAFGAHIYIAERIWLLQLIYPLEAFAARFTITCSANAPQWMAEALEDSTTFSPAGQLAYIDDHGAHHSCTMGWRGTTLLSDRVRPHHRFRLASVTKVTTSLAYATLEQQGKVNGQERVIDYFPFDRPLADTRLSDLRIEHLHRHTAGFDRYITPDPMFILRRRPWCPADMSKLYELQLDFAPAERAAYSNLSYCLLGQIIAKTLRTDFRGATRALLRLPDYNLDYFDGPYHADEVEYDFRNTGFFGEDYFQLFDFKANSAAIGLIGSAESITRLVYDHRHLLKPIFALDLKQMGCRLDTLRTCYYYSLAPMRKGNDGLLIFSHPGNIYGSTAFLAIDEHGGVMTWVGKGSPRDMATFDALQWKFYEKLSAHYAGKSQ